MLEIRRQMMELTDAGGIGGGGGGPEGGSDDVEALDPARCDAEGNRTSVPGDEAVSTG
jgi:hypothetical protein